MPTSEQIEQHQFEIDTLHEWSGENLSDDDKQVLAELANDARQAREADGTVAMEAADAAEKAQQALREEREAQADNDWRNNPDARQ